MTILFLLQVLALVVWMIPGHILPETGQRDLAWSQCLLMVSSLPSVKDLIVTTASIDDLQWEGTYMKDTGVVITAHSKLREPIHKVETLP
jgi:hypothetical protein